MCSSLRLWSQEQNSWHFTVKTTWESHRKIIPCFSSVQCLLLYHFYVNISGQILSPGTTEMEVTLRYIYPNNS